MNSSRKKIIAFLVIFFIALWAVFAYYYYTAAPPNVQKFNKLAYLGEKDHSVRDFKFANQDGDSITRADLKGKILVVEYFFTTCKGICPIMNENMSKVYNVFKNDDNVVILSHTVDPKRDSVAAMKAYAQGYDADSKHWMFLTGDKQELYNQAYYSYLVTAADSSKTDIASDFIHTQNWVLVDKDGHVRAHADDDGRVFPYDGTDTASVAQMIQDIKELETEK